MRYIRKDSEGRIVAVSEVPLEGFDPIQSATGDEMDEGVSALLASQRALVDSDREFVRVIEDLVTLLVDKNLIRFTDLPDAAQRKVIERQRIREDLSQQLQLLPDEGQDEGLI